MSSIEEELERRLGPDRVLRPDARPVDAGEDICRRPLGEPVVWVAPRSTEEVATVVELAREHSVAVVPVGDRTAYWAPLRLGGAIALSTARLREIEVDLDARVVRCGAGATFRDVDAATFGHGLELSIYPDAYGGTPVAAMVSTAFTSGVGMGCDDIAGALRGLEVVLGDGRVLRTGASTVLGGAAFMRHGLPDPSALFFASEGALGVITEVSLALRPRLHRARLSCELPRGREGHVLALRLAREMRLPGVYDTFRAEEHAGGAATEGAVKLDVDLIAPTGGAEREARVEWARRLLSERGVGEPRVTFDDPGGEQHIPRYWGEAHELWPQVRGGRLGGVDVNLSYGAVEDALDASDVLIRDAMDAPHLDLRRALYYAPGFVNLGLHFLFEASEAEAALRFEREGADAMAALGAVPYRWGRLWHRALSHRLEPAYLGLARTLKRTLDPDAILNPGVSVFDES